MHPSEVVFYFHIPKTGGSSVLSELYAVEGEEAVFGIEDAEAPDLAGRISRLLARDDGLRVVHGHFAPAKLAGLKNVCRAVLLRDPLERLQSHFCYHFQHRLRFRDDLKFFSQPQFAGERRFGLECFSQWIGLKKFDNYQTRFLVGNFKDPVDAAMQGRAEALLREMDIVGVCEALPAFLRRLSHVLHNRSLNLQHVNSSDRTVLQLAPAERQEIIDRFLRFDQALHQTACLLSEKPRVPLPILRERIAMPLPQRRLANLFRHRTALELLRRSRRSLFFSLRLAKARVRSKL